MSNYSPNELEEIASQLRKPDGDKGKEVGLMMNDSNGGMIKNSVDALKLKSNDKLLELGHGNGKHINLILEKGDNISYYGLDIYKKRNLAELITALSTVEGIEWIRLHYAYPSGFPMDVLDVIKDNPKVCTYIDMPLQHGSSKILKAMNRIILKQGVKVICLTTSILVIIKRW